jgi:hypothetical protein
VARRLQGSTDVETVSERHAECRTTTRGQRVGEGAIPTGLVPDDNENDARVVCPVCGEPVDPAEPSVTYAVPDPEEAAVGRFFHPGCPPGNVGYVPTTLPGKDPMTP